MWGAADVGRGPWRGARVRTLKDRRGKPPAGTGRVKATPPPPLAPLSVAPSAGHQSVEPGKDGQTHVGVGGPRDSTVGLAGTRRPAPPPSKETRCSTRPRSAAASATHATAAHNGLVTQKGSKRMGQPAAATAARRRRAVGPDAAAA